MTELFTPEEKQEIDRCNATRLAQLRADYEHSVPDWDAVLQLGFSGLLKRAERYRLHHRETGPLSPEADAFYESIRIEYRAILHFLDRLLAEAEKLRPVPVAHELTAALRQLRVGAPNTLYEALLQIWLYFQLSEYVDVIQTRSFGNLDRVLYPFYRHDLDSGRRTREEVRELFSLLPLPDDGDALPSRPPVLFRRNQSGRLLRNQRTLLSDSGCL
ncbi:MAG: pyruvate formate lyase family protein [Lentisphaeria bacterium]|nr:MAG: pyruvate formate lyase family protein [Lentisphaeria bacterium]